MSESPSACCKKPTLARISFSIWSPTFAMDIPYEVLDFTADFREKIIEKFIRVYEMGGTPNPCIDCNRYKTG